MTTDAPESLREAERQPVPKRKRRDYFLATAIFLPAGVIGIILVVLALFALLLLAGSGDKEHSSSAIIAAATLVGTIGLTLVVGTVWQSRKHAIEICEKLHSDQLLDARASAADRLAYWARGEHFLTVASYFPECERGRKIGDRRLVKEWKLMREKLGEDVDSLDASVKLYEQQSHLFKHDHGFSNILYLMQRSVAYRDAGMLDVRLFRKLNAAFFEHYNEYLWEFARVYNCLRRQLNHHKDEDRFNTGDNILSFLDLIGFDLDRRKLDVRTEGSKGSEDRSGGKGDGPKPKESYWYFPNPVGKAVIDFVAKSKKERADGG